MWLEQLSDGNLLLRQSVTGGYGKVVDDACAHAQPASEECRPAHTADGGANVEVRESNPLARNFIHVWGHSLSCFPIGAQVAPAPVISEENDDVRLHALGSRWRSRRGPWWWCRGRRRWWGRWCGRWGRWRIALARCDACFCCRFGHFVFEPSARKSMNGRWVKFEMDLNPPAHIIILCESKGDAAFLAPHRARAQIAALLSTVARC